MTKLSTTKPIVPPTLTLEAFDIPSDEIMQKLDIEPAEFPDFITAINITILQTKGKTIKQACVEVGITSGTLYNEKWQKLLYKARQLFTGFLLFNVSGAAQQVYDEWPSIVQSIINVAKFGARDHEKVAAAELLYKIYIEPVQTNEKDTRDVENYLKKPKNFSPLQPIQVTQGGTLIINNVPVPVYSDPAQYDISISKDEASPDKSDSNSKQLAAGKEAD